MKQLKIAAMGLFLISALAACGKNTEKTYTEEELAQMSDKELEELLEQQIEDLENDEKIEEKKDTENTSDKGSIEPTQEVIDAEWYSGKIQIEDIVIQLPISVNELSELGFEYKLSSDMSEDYLFDETQTIPLSFYLDDKEVFLQGFPHHVEGLHTASEILEETDLIMNDLSSLAYTDSNSTVYYAGGLKIGDSVRLIEERLGTPYEITSDHRLMQYNYGTYSTNNSQCYMTINVDRETQLISSITYTVDIIPTTLDLNTFTTLSANDVICSHDDSVHNFSVNVMPNASYVGNVNSYFILDGQVYSFTMSVSVYNHFSDSSYPILFSETDANGITRTLEDHYGSYNYTVSNDNYRLNGYISITNVSIDDEQACYSNEQILNAVTEIVKSIQFDNM